MQTKQELGPLQREWLEALRSGKYPQGQNWLCKDGRYCCLGVACDLFADRLEVPRTWRAGFASFGEDSAVVPPPIRNALRLHTCGAQPKEDSHAASLITLNDTGATFTEIADLIESDPSVYFTEPA